MLKNQNAVTPVRLEPVTPWSHVKQSTTEPLGSLLYVLHERKGRGRAKEKENEREREGERSRERERRRERVGMIEGKGLRGKEE